MSFLGKIADLFIEVSEQGAEVCKASIEGIKDPLEAVKIAADKASEPLGEIAKAIEPEFYRLSSTIGTVTQQIDNLGKSATDSLGDIDDLTKDTYKIKFEPSELVMLTGQLKDFKATMKDDFTIHLVNGAAVVSEFGHIETAAKAARAAQADEQKQRDAFRALFKLPGEFAKPTDGKPPIVAPIPSVLPVKDQGIVPKTPEAPAAPRLRLPPAEESKGFFEPIEKATKSVNELGLAFKVAFVDRGVNLIQGFVRAGLQGSGVMQLLDFRTQQMARGVAAIFVPAIEAVSAGIQRVSDWLHKLTGEQQNVLLGFAGAAAAASIVAGAIGVVGKAVVGLAVDFGILDVASGGILLIVGAVATLGGAIAALAVGTQTGRETLKTLWSVGKPIFDALADGFKSIWTSAQPIFEKIGQLWETVWGGISPHIGELKEVITATATKISDAFDKAMPDIERFIDAISPVAAMIAEAFVVDQLESFISILEAIVDPILKVVEALGEVNDALDAIAENSAFGEIGKLVKHFLAANTGGLIGGRSEERKLSSTGGDFDDTHREVPLPVGHFEKADYTFKRVQIAALSADTGRKKPEEETAANTAAATGWLEQIAGLLGNRRPLFTQ